MKELKNVISIILIASWAALLGILMYRMPIATVLGDSQMYQEISVGTLDMTLSLIFSVVVLISCVAGYFFRSKTLLLLSGIQTLLLLLAITFLTLFFMTMNGDLFAFFLYLANPYTALLLLSDIWFFAFSVPVLVLTLILPPLFLILYKVKLKNGAKKVFRVK